MVAYADTNPTVEIRYHSVPDGHADEPALDLLSDLLNGRTGRLQKSLVLKQAIANSASGSQTGRKYEGFYELSGVAKPGHTPEEVEQALYKEIERLQKEPVAAEELQKVKNQNAAAAFRRLQSNFFLMIQLLVLDAGRGWQTINTDPARTQAVTAKDIMRVANAYFAPENRTVAIYYTKKGAASDDDPMMAGLSDEDKQQFKQAKAGIAQANAEQIKTFLANFDQQTAAAPPEKKNLLKAIKKLLEDRLKQLEGGNK
jgi:peptidase M16-like protein